MSPTVVTTQAELDAALAAKAREIHIQSAPGAWLTLTDSGSSRVVAWGSSRVVAWGSSRVEAWGSSRVEAWGSSSVEARESSSVEARESSRVEAWGSSRVEARGSSRVEARESSRVEARESSRVEARESSRVEAWGSSRVEAWGSSRVEARGSSRVVAWGSSRVVAWGSSRVEARGSSRVEARESSRVVAGKYVAVHLHSQTVRLTGQGHIIDMTALDKSDPQTWADLYGAKVSRGRMTVYKGVNADLTSAHRTTYPIGKTVGCDDWKAVADCGNGLHFSPSPISTEAYCTPERYLECTVKLADVIPLGDKIKAPACKVVREVDRFGDPVVAS